jgi:hypothetical protein
MAWFVFELRRHGCTTTELEQFPLLETALKYGIDDLMRMSRDNKQVSIGVGEVRGANVDWLGELSLDAQGRPTWNSTSVQEREASVSGAEPWP